MITLDSLKKEYLKDPEFKKLYEEEKKKLTLAVELAAARESQKLSQKQLAKKANVTQQQLSRVENGVNVNTKTIQKICNALGLRLTVVPANSTN